MKLIVVVSSQYMSSQVMVLYALNLHRAVCQLISTKLKEKIKTRLYGYQKKYIDLYNHEKRKDC